MEVQDGKNPETVRAVRGFTAKGAEMGKEQVSWGRNGAVEKVRKEIRAVGEVGGIKGGNLGD